MAADQESQQDGDLQSPTSNTERLLPTSRVRTIMKSSPDVENISQDALSAVTAATELFIKDLAKKVHSSLSDPSGDISYNDLANLVNTDDAYSFLDEIIPRKVSGRDILAARRAAEQEQNGAGGDHSADEEEDEEEKEADTEVKMETGDDTGEL